MEKFKLAHASTMHWQDALENCIRQLGTIKNANLGFLYITDAWANDMEDIYEYVHDYTNIPNWVGTVGVGICCTGKEYFNIPAVVMMVGEFPEDSFKVFNEVDEDLADFCQNHQTWCDNKQAMFAIVHGDPQNKRISDDIVQLSERIGDGFLVGGLSSSRSEHLQLANQIVSGGLSGVMFNSNISVATRLTQGCSLLGKRHEITESHGNIIIRLDDRPALDVFNEIVGKDIAEDLNRAAGYIFFALPIQGSDTGDYLVRNLVGIDPDNKMLAIGEFVESGMTINLAVRDSETAKRDLLRMLNNLKSSLSTPPRGGVYFSCLGRGESLFGKGGRELTMIQEELGDFPLVGFFANGEISHQRLYSYTGVLTVFL